jgi:hypothetical protein
MAKPKSPEQEAAEETIVVDILEMEMSKGLPHWLDPIEKYKGEFAEDRRQRQMKRSKAQQRKNKRDRE